MKENFRPAGVTALSISSFIVSLIFGWLLISALPVLAFSGTRDDSLVFYIALPFILFILAIHLWRMMWLSIFYYLLSGLCVGVISVLFVKFQLYRVSIDPNLVLSFIIFYSLYILVFFYLLKKRKLFH